MARDEEMQTEGLSGHQVVVRQEEQPAGQAGHPAPIVSAGRITTYKIASNPDDKFIDFDGIDCARRFWCDVVEPNLEDFRQHRTPRSEHNIATSLYALAMWIWYDRHPTDHDREAHELFRHALVGKCSHFAILGEMADGWKHRALRSKHRSVKRTDAVTDEINKEDGTLVALSDVFEKVAACLQSELGTP